MKWFAWYMYMLLTYIVCQRWMLAVSQLKFYLLIETIQISSFILFLFYNVCINYYRMNIEKFLPSFDAGRKRSPKNILHVPI